MPVPLERSRLCLKADMRTLNGYYQNAAKFLDS